MGRLMEAHILLIGVRCEMKAKTQKKEKTDWEKQKKEGKNFLSHPADDDASDDV